MVSYFGITCFFCFIGARILVQTGGAACLVEPFTPSTAIVTRLKKLHHINHLALETSLQCNCSSKYSAGYYNCIGQNTAILAIVSSHETIGHLLLTTEVSKKSLLRQNGLYINRKCLRLIVRYSPSRFLSAF